MSFHETRTKTTKICQYDENQSYEWVARANPLNAAYIKLVKMSILILIISRVESEENNVSERHAVCIVRALQHIKHQNKHKTINVLTAYFFSGYLSQRSSSYDIHLISHHCICRCISHSNIPTHSGLLHLKFSGDEQETFQSTATYNWEKQLSSTVRTRYRTKTAGNDIFKIRVFF
jgi:hypothetical protein